MQKLSNPHPIFLDARGALVDGGYIYIGIAGDDPETAPVSVYWDAAGTIPAVQPLRTSGGLIVNGASPAFVYVDADDFSIRVRDADASQVFYVSSAAGAEPPEFQPLDSDLTAIAALSTTAFGRSLLEAADATALRSLAGIGSYLALTGGTMSGNIVRSGAGPHLYHASGALGSGRVFVTDAAAADPTSLAGDVWIKLS